MANQKVVGIFSSQQEAVKAIERLKRDGYTDEEISVLAKDSEDVERVKEATNVDIDTKDAAGGAAGGAVAGGALGGIAAVLIELGVIAIPGVGPFLAAGPVAAALTGALAGGAVGGIVGALVDMGLSKEEAEEYEGYVDRGDILVMVDEHPDRDVRRTFADSNSVIRDTYGERYNQEYVETDSNRPMDPNSRQPAGRGRPASEDRPLDPNDPNRPVEDDIPFDPNRMVDPNAPVERDRPLDPNDPNRPR